MARKNGRARSIQNQSGNNHRERAWGCNFCRCFFASESPMRALFAHRAERLRLCRDRYSLVPQSSHSALHLFVEEVSPAFRHRLKLFCFICRGNKRLRCLSVFQVEGTVIFATRASHCFVASLQTAIPFFLDIDIACS